MKPLKNLLKKQIKLTEIFIEDAQKYGILLTSKENRVETEHFNKGKLDTYREILKFIESTDDI